MITFQNLMQIHQWKADLKSVENVANEITNEITNEVRDILGVDDRTLANAMTALDLVHLTCSIPVILQNLFLQSMEADDLRICSLMRI